MPNEQYAEELENNKATIAAGTRTTDGIGTTTGGATFGDRLPSRVDQSTVSTTGGVSTMTDNKQIFECLQCGRSLDEATYKREFEFNATDIMSGEVQVEGRLFDGWLTLLIMSK